MPRYPDHESLSAGFTFLELVLGVFLIGVVSLVLGRMMRSFVMLTNYTLKQTSVLANARMGLTGKGKAEGLVWATQEAAAVRSLSTSTFQLTTPAPAAIDYYVTNFVSTSYLVQNQAGVITRQSPNVTGLHVDYSEMGSNGRVFESTVAAQAAMAAFTLTLAGKGKTKTYTVYSAAQMRNR